MKTKILALLQQQEGIISGEELSKQLGVSRVTIWKHIKALQKLGYEISSSPKGYSCKGENDFLYPWEFKERQSFIYHYQSVSSTMDIARELARKGAKDQSVVVAQSQEKGRGRLQRKWFSKQGGLYFTLILRPEIPAASGFLMNFVTATALAETIRELTGIEAMVKWPNDILVGTKKLSGMLSEMEAEAEMVTFVNIGIGINVNNDPTGDEKTATSIAKELGREVSRRTLLSRFLDNLETKLEGLDLDGVVKNWKKNTMTIGKDVEIVTTTEITRGHVLDVDDSGALILKIEDGSIKKVIYGDCFHI